MTEISIVEYGGWKNCHRLQNGLVELIITGDVGPRVIRYGFIGSDNEMCEVADQLGKTGGEEWRIYGGHRLWHSPEGKPRSYFPDNVPCDVSIIENGVHISQLVETTTGIKKDIEITLDPNSSGVTLRHYLANEGMWAVELAAWALTVMAPGGIEVVPQNQLDTGLLPNRMLSLWPYTKFNDPRVTWGEKFILLRQDPKNTNAFKFGISNTDGWAAYANHGNLFVKKFIPVDGALYPDYSGSSYETYTIDFMLEMETLSPLSILEPGESIVHVETWQLFRNVTAPETEKDVEDNIIKLI
ncbi:MAG: hypothetical protein JXB33_09645 [Clostridia bacterium]|nr:hypothetical protein [Clostridia bacterium]